MAQSAVDQDDEQAEEHADRVEVVQRHRPRMVRPGS
jgi:hypothetical protein